MKLDTTHYTLHDNGTVTDKAGRLYLAPSSYPTGRTLLYRGGGMCFGVVDSHDYEGINAEFIRRGIRPPYVP